MAVASDACVRSLLAFSTLEASAIALDRIGNSSGALKLYKAAETELEAAVQSAHIAHESDKPRLVQHLKEMRTRMQYLGGLNGNQPAISVEDHIKARPVALMRFFRASVDVLFRSIMCLKTLDFNKRVGCSGEALKKPRTLKPETILKQSSTQNSSEQGKLGGGSSKRIKTRKANMVDEPFTSSTRLALI